MPVELNLTSGETDDVVPRLMQTLVAGGLVRLDIMAASWALAHATEDAAAERFLGLSETSPAALMVIDGDQAGDFLQTPSPTLNRLMRGGYGPLIVSIHQQLVDKSLVAVLPEATQSLVQRGEWLNLAPPTGSLTRQVLGLIPGPLLVCHAANAKTGSKYDMLVTDSSSTNHSPSEIRIHRTGDWELVSSSVLTTADVQRIMAQRIIFVCTGNTCRSPIAEAMFRSLLAARIGCAPDELPQNGYDVASAGLAAMAGAPASPESVQLCAEQGVDLTAHASQPLTEQLLQQADRLYTMTAGHREAILSRYPDLSDRVQVLSRNGEDVSDPIGWGQAAYEQSYAEITENLRVLVEELTAQDSPDDDQN